MNIYTLSATGYTKCSKRHTAISLGSSCDILIRHLSGSITRLDFQYDDTRHFTHQFFMYSLFTLTEGLDFHSYLCWPVGECVCLWDWCDLPHTHLQRHIKKTTLHICERRLSERISVPDSSLHVAPYFKFMLFLHSLAKLPQNSSL